MCTAPVCCVSDDNAKGEVKEAREKGKDGKIAPPLPSSPILRETVSTFTLSGQT
jgi:hypothetical protein